MKKIRKKLCYFSLGFGATALSSILLSACSTNSIEQVKPRTPEETKEEFNTDKQQDTSYFKDFDISVKNKVYPSQLLVDSNTNSDFLLNKNYFIIKKSNEINDDNIILKAKSFDDDNGTLEIEVKISLNTKTQIKIFKFNTLNKINLSYSILDAVKVNLSEVNTENKSIDKYVKYFNDQSLTNEQKLNYLKELGNISIEGNEGNISPLTLDIVIKNAIQDDNQIHLEYIIQAKQKYLKSNDKDIKYRIYYSKLNRVLNVSFNKKTQAHLLLDQATLKTNFNKGTAYPSFFKYIFNQDETGIDQLFPNSDDITQYHGEIFSKLGTGYSDIKLIFNRNLSDELNDDFVSKMFNLPHDYDVTKYAFRISSIINANDKDGTMKVVLTIYDKGDNFNDSTVSLSPVVGKEFTITGLNKWENSNLDKFNVSFYSGSKSWNNFLSNNQIVSKINAIWDEPSQELDLTSYAQRFKGNLQNYFDIFYDKKTLSFNRPDLYPFPIVWWHSFHRDTFKIKKIYIKNNSINESNKYLFADIEYPIEIDGFETQIKKETISQIIHKNENLTNENPKYYLG